jgi:hypothetical protein
MHDLIPRSTRELDRLIEREERSLIQAKLKMAGVYSLTTHAVVRHVGLNALINAVSQGNPGLELQLRTYEQVAGALAGGVITDYGMACQ